MFISVIYDCTSLKFLPIFPSFAKAAKHVHQTELGTMACIDFFKHSSSKNTALSLLYQAWGRQLRVESEKGAME